jgi:hypothetical protein
VVDRRAILQSIGFEKLYEPFCWTIVSTGNECSIITSLAGDYIAISEYVHLVVDCRSIVWGLVECERCEASFHQGGKERDAKVVKKESCHQTKSSTSPHHHTDPLSTTHPSTTTENVLGLHYDIADGAAPPDCFGPGHFVIWFDPFVCRRHHGVNKRLVATRTTARDPGTATSSKMDQYGTLASGGDGRRGRIGGGGVRAVRGPVVSILLLLVDDLGGRGGRVGELGLFLL